MRLDLTLIYRADADQPHVLDSFAQQLPPAVAAAHDDIRRAFRRGQVDVEGVDISVQRVEATVGDVSTIQKLLEEKKSALRGMLLVDYSVDDAFSIAESDDDVSAKQRRVNIYESHKLALDEEKTMSRLFAVAKQQGYESVFFVLRAIGDHTMRGIDASEEDLLQQYVSGDMTGASPEHRMLCDVLNRDGIFSTEPEFARASLNRNIASLSFLLHHAKQAGFTDDQLRLVPFLEDVPQQEHILVISDRHARQGEAKENVASHEIVLPIADGLRGFQKENRADFMHESVDISTIVRAAISNCLTPGRVRGWLNATSK